MCTLTVARSGEKQSQRPSSNFVGSPCVTHLLIPACTLCCLDSAHKVATYPTHDQKQTLSWTINVQACVTPNYPEPQPFLYFLRQCQHPQGTLVQFPLEQAIACVVKYGNQRLQQRRHGSIVRPALYVRQRICNQLSRVQILRSKSSLY